MAMPEYRIFTIGPDGHFVGVPKLQNLPTIKRSSRRQRGQRMVRIRRFGIRSALS
jgi:hypothetical protein